MPEKAEFVIDDYFNIYANSVGIPEKDRQSFRRSFVAGMKCVTEFMDFTTKHAMNNPNPKCIGASVGAVELMRVAVQKAHAEYYCSNRN